MHRPLAFQASKPFQQEASFDSGLSSLRAPQSIHLLDNTNTTAARYGVQLSKNIRAFREVRGDVQNSTNGFGFALLKVLAGSRPVQRSSLRPPHRHMLPRTASSHGTSGWIPLSPDYPWLVCAQKQNAETCVSTTPLLFHPSRQ